jgi:hypothetical protein
MANDPGAAWSRDHRSGAGGAEQSQIHIGDKALIDHLDFPRRGWQGVRIDPADGRKDERMTLAMPRASAKMSESTTRQAIDGVTIEAKYTVGEYDILILSATQSSGLERWLKDNGYRVPAGASQVLGGYIKQNIKFFVAKVNLKEQKKLGFTYLRPIQIAFESPKFALPIRLGMVNSNGSQELFVYAMSRKGRVETVNYRTIKLPSDRDVPEYVKGEFSDFYRALFSRQVKLQGMQVVFTEYAWDMSWCDPCAASR